MKLKFPYGISNSPGFGVIHTIFLWLYVESSTNSLPASVAKKLRIDLDKCPQEPMTGYEGTSVLVYKSQIKIRFNKEAFVIPCVFHPNEEVPILLGRAGIIDKFNILLDGKNKAIIFEEI